MNATRNRRRVVNFGPAQRRMVGVLHEPAVPGTGLPAVLLCGPMGQEAFRAHRVLLVLADRLARAGMPALRFDYYGTGDSAGDDLEGDIDGWVDDVMTADTQIRGLTGASAVAWLGLRVGALLAARASASSRVAPGALVLWDPIMDGAAYLKSLALADRRAVMQGFSLNRRLYRALAITPIPDAPTQALGFELSDRLREQLLGVDERAMDGLRTSRLTVAASAGSERISRLLAVARSAGIAAESKILRTAVDWATNDASGSTIAPTDIVELVVPAALELSK